MFLALYYSQSLNDMGSCIYVVSFGSVESRLLIACAKNIKEIFSLEVRISSVRLPLNFDRNRYKASDFLSHLRDIHFPHMVRLLALVSFDIYEEGFNFVFGVAQEDKAVVSLFRLHHSEETVFFERVFKEVNHELGHTFGLKHCHSQKCVMRFSNSVKEVDIKSKYFCKNCLSVLTVSLEPYRRYPWNCDKKPC